MICLSLNCFNICLSQFIPGFFQSSGWLCVLKARPLKQKCFTQRPWRQGWFSSGGKDVSRVPSFYILLYVSDIFYFLTLSSPPWHFLAAIFKDLNTYCSFLVLRQQSSRVQNALKPNMFSKRYFWAGHETRVWPSCLTNSGFGPMRSHQSLVLICSIYICYHILTLEKGDIHEHDSQLWLSYYILLS